MNSMDALKERWIYIIRTKAGEYEHRARGRGEPVSEPSLDTICNEINAFFVGLNQGIGKE